MPKKHYKTDTEVGIRPINVIRALPSCELNDEEFVKEFFERFGAKALILAYFDDKDEVTCLGRLKRGAQPFKYYRTLASILKKCFELAGTAHIKEME